MLAIQIDCLLALAVIFILYSVGGHPPISTPHCRLCATFELTHFAVWAKLTFPKLRYYVPRALSRVTHPPYLSCHSPLQIGSPFPIDSPLSCELTLLYIILLRSFFLALFLVSAIQNSILFGPGSSRLLLSIFFLLPQFPLTFCLHSLFVVFLLLFSSFLKTFNNLLCPLLRNTLGTFGPPVKDDK